MGASDEISSGARDEFFALRVNRSGTSNRRVAIDAESADEGDDVEDVEDADSNRSRGTFFTESHQATGWGRLFPPPRGTLRPVTARALAVSPLALPEPEAIAKKKKKSASLDQRIFCFRANRMMLWKMAPIPATMRKHVR